MRGVDSPSRSAKESVSSFSARRVARAATGALQGQHRGLAGGFGFTSVNRDGGNPSQSLPISKGTGSLGISPMVTGHSPSRPPM